MRSRVKWDKVGWVEFFVRVGEVMIDHLRAMAIFSKVVEVGSFRAAGKALGLSPSVVSHHVSELEAHLDCALLYRSTRRMSLTDEGAQLHAASSEMIRAAETGLSALSARADQPSGRLKVTVPATVFETDRCLDGITAFLRQHPKVNLSLGFSDQKIELIGSQIDVAVRVGVRLEDSRYKARKLCELERTLVVAPTYLRGRKPPKSITELAALDWIKLSQFSPAKQMVSRSGDTPDFDPHVAIEVDSVGALRGYALKGLGVAAIPNMLVASNLDAGELISLDVGWHLMAPGMHAIWPGNAPTGGLAKRFVNHLTDWFAEDR